MFELINSCAEQYASNFTSAESDLLASLADFTRNHHKEPHMLSGHVQGRFLQMISCLLNPLHILEIGTFTGYSALCLASGLQANGKLHTIEFRKEDAELSGSFFKRSVNCEKIIVHNGDAHKIIPTLDISWDLVFIDADKTGYIEYYDLTLPFLKTNGLMIVDNVLFHGEVLKENITGRSAKAIDAFNRYVAADSRVEVVMLTVRDGISLIRKL